MNKGDIVLVPFPFTNLTGTKVRPALVLVVDTFDITLAFITSKIFSKSVFDVDILPSAENGLKAPFVIRLSKLAIFRKNLLSENSVHFPERK